MALYTEQVVAGVSVADEVVRGATYQREFEFYANANAGENAQALPPALGTDLDLSSSLGVLAVGRVLGTNARITVEAVAVTLGSTDPATPARVAVTVSNSNISNLCYAEGAARAFQWTLYYFDANAALTPLVGAVVTCVESGAGGTA